MIARPLTTAETGGTTGDGQMTDAQMPIEAHDINSKLAQLQEAQKGRLNEIAQADPVWAHLAGQIEALTWAQQGGSENGSVSDLREQQTQRRGRWQCAKSVRPYEIHRAGRKIRQLR